MNNISYNLVEFLVLLLTTDFPPDFPHAVSTLPSSTNYLGEELSLPTYQLTRAKPGSALQTLLLLINQFIS